MKLPAWFWPWAAWMDSGKRGPRPPAAPKKIPAWAWARYALHHAGKPKPVPPPVSVKTTWAVFTKAPLCWINDLGSFPTELGLPLLRSGGYEAIVVQVLDGTKPVPIDSVRVQQYQHAGIKVLGWGWGKGDDPALEARAGAGMVAHYGFSGYVLNAEKPYDAYDENGVWRADRYARSQEFVNAWDKTIPLGVSPEPRSGMRHEAWQEIDACYMPQAYPQENGAHVGSVVDFGRSVGWPVTSIVPLCGVYEHNGNAYPGGAHRIEATLAGVPNVCLYYGDGCLNMPDQWTGLAGE